MSIRSSSPSTASAPVGDDGATIRVVVIVIATVATNRGMSQVDPLGDRGFWSRRRARNPETGLWILPDLWKTPQTGVSHRSLDGAQTAPPPGLHP